MKRRDFLQILFFSSLSFSYLFASELKSFQRILIISKNTFDINLIKKINPSLVLFLNDGEFSGIGATKNRYNEFNLFCEANFVKNHLNIFDNELKLFISKNNLVDLCLKNNIKSFEIQLFKRLSIDDKKDISFKIIKEFCKLNDIKEVIWDIQQL